MTGKYEAVVVGARVAGAAAAAFLSHAGCRVLLLDRAPVSRPPVSSPIFFANTLHALRRLGMLPRVEALGSPPLRLYQVRLGDIFLRGRMLPYQGIDHAFSIRRERLDAAFLEHTSALSGVETRLGFNVTGLLWDDDHKRVMGVRGNGPEGREEEIQADLVVGADGYYSAVAREVRAPEFEVRPAHTCVYYAYYRNVKRAGPEPSASMYYDTTAPLAFITADSDDGLTVVSLSLPASRFHEVRGEVGALHWQYAARVPELAERMSAAVRETPIRGMSPRPSRYRVPFGPGWVLVGDAGCYKDPLTGQGIHDALRSAELAAAAFLENRQGAEWKTAMGRFQAARDRETRVLYEFTDYHADLGRTISPAEWDLFRALAEMPHWSDRYVSLFNGVTDAGQFASRANLLRILAEWRARRLWRRLTGRPVLMPAGSDGA